MAGVPDPIGEMLERLCSVDAGIREQGLEELKTLKGAEIDETLGLRLLEAAARIEGRSDPPISEEASTQLVLALLDQPRTAYVSVILRNFERYRGEASKWAIAVLTEEPSGRGLEAFARILSRHAAKPDFDIFPRTVSSLAQNPAAATLPLPEILHEVLDHKFGYAAQQLLLDQITRDLISPDRQALFAVPLRKHVGSLLDRAETALGRGDSSSLWSDAYSDLRWGVLLSLDLLGRLAPFRDATLFRRALGSRDPRLSLCAAITLLRVGHPVDGDALDRIAASTETRNQLYDELQNLDRLDLMPSPYATQASLAESAMVDWLTYPTELNRSPDEIELMRVITFHNSEVNETQELYVFRFRVFEPHWAASDGWMAGIAGPFSKNQAPQTHGSHTFSEFDPWDSMSLDAHVTKVFGNIEDYHEHRARFGDE